MTEAADLVMPKLGLTMTEGRVAQWAVKAGERFARGDVVVVIETDKIANDVEAPAPGRLLDILADEGVVVPVGTPIARWALEGARPRPSSHVEASRSAEPAAAVTTLPQPIRSVPRSGSRIVATPFARRLARDAALDLAAVAGSGPSGRIKAADVERALEMRRAPSPVALVAAPAAVTLGARLSFATIDVDVDALQAIQTSLARAGQGKFRLQHYVALACLRAFEPHGRDSVTLGFELPDGDSTDPAAIEAGRRESLSSLAAKLALRAEVQGAADVAGGDLAIHVAEGGLHHFAPAAPAGWRMALGVGSVRRAETTTRELSLVLSYDAGTVDHGAAARFLAAMKALLEEPLQLLAS
ncbi:MAG: E3 binding domain-containing protein [Hyphomicrobiaceae bacterium]|nr:E3 binding domain-containing protein [Hyphomicrobiaceae bacterium]